MRVTPKMNKECCECEKKLSRAEIKELNRITDALEKEFFWEYRNISGGFADATMVQYDDEYIDIELRYGEQDTGSGSHIHTENCKIPRVILLKKMSFNEKCKAVEFD